MFLITMAGLSSRFFKAGYSRPKYQLDIEGRTAFALSVLSFARYFKTDLFLFVVRDIYGTPDFVQQEATSLGISNFKIVVLEQETRGQAETAYLAVNQEPIEEPIFIFNIDTFRNNYIKPEFIDECEGYLEVFEGEGTHWSFVLPGEKHTVLQTSEKQRISNLCSDGLYYFRTRELFCSAYVDALSNEKLVNGEIYIAPLYNFLIDSGHTIKYESIRISDIDFCGTPEEYELLLSKRAKSNSEVVEQ